MPFNLLLLPLIGGFWLLRHWNRTRFFLARQDPQRLLIWSAIAGLALLAIAVVIVTGILALGNYGPPLTQGTIGWAVEVWHTVFPFPHAGKAVAALAAGFLAPPLLNRIPPWSSPDLWAVSASEYYGDEVESVLLRSLTPPRKPVLISLRTGKVYVGYVRRNVNPEVERRHLRLVPVASGHRTGHGAGGDLRVQFTTWYTTDGRQPRGEAAARLSDVDVAIPLADVATLSLFDWTAYEASLQSEAAPDRGVNLPTLTNPPPVPLVGRATRPRTHERARGVRARRKARQWRRADLAHARRLSVLGWSLVALSVGLLVFLVWWT